MKFISIYTHVPTNRAPTEAEMTRMGNLVEEAMTEGLAHRDEACTSASKACACTRARPAR